MQDALLPRVYPIALGRRGGGLCLAVPAPSAPPRFDVVVSVQARPDARRAVEQLAALGHRVVDYDGRHRELPDLAVLEPVSAS